MGYLTAAALAALGTLAVAVGAASIARWRFLHRRIREYVSVVPDALPASLPSSSATDRPSRRGAPRAARGRLGSLQKRLTRTSYAARVQARLICAGSARRASGLIALQAALGIGVMLAASLVFRGLPPGLRPLAAVLCGAGAAYAPLLLLDLRAKRRQTAFETQLPPAIDAMASSLRAGSTLHQAMAVLAREMSPPISIEFGRVLRETEVGLTFPDAMAGLAERVPSGDLTLFISAISIQQRVGGDLAEILRTISHTIRERLRVRGEMRVMTAQARYSSYIVASLPVLLFLFLWTTNRSYVAPMFQPGIARVMFLMGGAGIVLGFFSMNRLARVDL
jgi:tight adherence protein B